jgi:hypothetical protein
VIVQALQNFGKRYSIATFQAARAQKYRQAPEADTKFMEDHANLDDHGAHLSTQWEGFEGEQAPASALGAGV